MIQLLEQKRSGKSFDFRRLAVFTSVASLYIAPAIHNWFNWIHHLPIPDTVGRIGKAGLQMLVDQTAGAVIINMGFFYAFELAQSLFPPYSKADWNFLNAGTLSVTNNMWKTLIANWYCWPRELPAIACCILVCMYDVFWFVCMAVTCTWVQGVRPKNRAIIFSNSFSFNAFFPSFFCMFRMIVINFVNFLVIPLQYR